MRQIADSARLSVALTMGFQWRRSLHYSRHADWDDIRNDGPAPRGQLVTYSW